MTKCRLMIILLISLNVINVIKCTIPRTMAALKSAGHVSFNISIHFYPAVPITELNVVQDLMGSFESGLSSDEQLNQDMKNLLHTALHRVFKSESKTKTLLNNFYKSLNKIDEHFAPFERLLSLKSDPNLTAIEEYSNKILSSTNGVSSSLNDLLQTTLVDVNFFDVLSSYSINLGYCDDLPKLRQHHIVHFFNVLLNKVYKGNFLIVSAHKFIMRLKSENHVHRVKKALAEAYDHLKEYADNALNGLSSASKEICLCDSDVNIKDKTYTEIVGPSQGFIFDSSEVTERQQCELLNDEKDRCKKDNPTCFGHTCSTSGGVLKKCETLSNETLTICPANDGSKKYLSAESNSDKYGNQTSVKSCPNNKLERVVSKVRVYSETGVPDQYLRPNYFCYCSCERSRWLSGDVRSISLQWATADYESNKVLTGLRFVEKHGMISLQAQQGLILSGGVINQSTVSWKELAFPEIHETTGVTPKYVYPSKAKKGLAGKILVPNEHYIYISTDLSINLDTINIPDDHVIIGVKLAKSESPNDSGHDVVELAVMTVTYHDISGRLDLGSISNTTATRSMHLKFNHSQRERMQLGYVGNPLLMNKKHTYFSGHHKQLKFRQTDLRKDLGQSIVPFIDTREVTTSPAIPISSVGLYHRGASGSGGFVGLKLESYDLIRNFNTTAYVSLDTFSGS